MLTVEVQASGKAQDHPVGDPELQQAPVVPFTTDGGVCFGRS